MNRKGDLGSIILIIFVIFTGLYTLNWYFGWSCHIEDWTSKDKYCVEGYGSNVTNALPDYQVRSHEQDRLDGIARDERRKRIDEEAKQAQICYDQGYDVNKSLDIIADYNLSCAKLEYINDHFVDKVDQKDGGYIDGSSFGVGVGIWGFGFSSGSIDGKFYDYVVTRVSATGQLVQQGYYHVDCNGNKHNEQIDYYTEPEFVMYYVNHCVEEKK